MRNFVLIGLALLLFSGCSSGNKGELVGQRLKEKYLESQPYGMVKIPQGALTIGMASEDISFAITSPPKVITQTSFWMDKTEITNSEYSQFIKWVKDSITRQLLADEGLEDYMILEDKDGNLLQNPKINWRKKVKKKDPEVQSILEALYIPDEDGMLKQKIFDVTKLNFVWVYKDNVQAAKARRNPKTGLYEGTIINGEGERVPITGESSFYIKKKASIYPDTLCWAKDFTYSFNEPMIKTYFWHPRYYEYPVVGVNWNQATAFAAWRTKMKNEYLSKNGRATVNEYRLPSEYEWEYAARGGFNSARYPWGGPYTRNQKGCFLANFKPLRGRYDVDGAIYTAQTGSYPPNNYGLFDMAGNVAEWTETAYDPSAIDFVHDLNPNYTYTAKESDPRFYKSKVIKGGSWKDVSLFLMNGQKSYEYQDVSKSFIGFRCIRTSM